MFLIHIYDVLRYEPIEKRSKETQKFLESFSIWMNRKQTLFVDRFMRENYGHEPF